MTDDFFETNVAQFKHEFPSISEIDIASKNSLYCQGESNSHVFWIKSGIVKLSYLTVQGTEVTIALIKKGEVLGFLPNHPEPHTMEETAQAIGNVQCYQMSHHDFKILLLQHPQLLWPVFEKTYARKQNIEHKLRTILTQPVEMRLATTLLELADMFGIECSHGYALEIHLTQQDVADLIGASRSVVSTLLNNFRSNGILDYTRDQICINDTALTNAYRSK
ncbi:Crp/Fnr family transcriptional regulator [Nitrosomonas sp.]|uniref:Crp/Fnr family transcriptional regulator n=1 Tax=Nitrosomonas sp. TaxID=42353 RepID=UPI001D217DD1|nr:Crp/Fnr family transcriptional regulator [Nitrosomonas sp.]MBX3616638.1 Crp/Fnr family transcriptional regulator [Nitrosomonas sp.]